MFTFRKSIKVVDAVLNSLPIVSTFSNGFKLLYKLAHKVNEAAHFVGQGRLDDIKIHIINRSILECLWGMVPILSNLTNVLHHLFVNKPLPKQLSEAVKAGNLEVVKLYLANHPLNQTPDKAKKMIKLAAKESTLEVFNEILKSYEWKAEDLFATLQNYGFPKTLMDEAKRATILSLLDYCHANLAKFTEEFNSRKEWLISYSQNFRLMDEPKIADKILNVLQAIDKHVRQTEAAITIQKHFRGYLSRKSFLPRSLYPRYSALCNNPNLLWLKIPRSRRGKTPVLLPEEIPEVILKICNYNPENNVDVSFHRFHKMRWVRNILRSQQSANLVIPRAAICNNVLVEERLPIIENEFINMGLYLTEPSLYNDAICELAKLFVIAPIEYLVLDTRHGDIVRWDNLPLYIVKEKGQRKGKIGLIDLERCLIQFNPRIAGLKNLRELLRNFPLQHRLANLKSLRELVRIFPYHFDLIWESFFQEAGVDLNQPPMQERFSETKKELEEIVGRAKECYNRDYTEHLSWLNSKHVTIDSDFRFGVSLEREMELAILVQRLLPSSDKQLACEVVRSIINDLSQYIEKFQEKRKQSIRRIVNSNAEMIRLRTILINSFSNLQSFETLNLVFKSVAKQETGQVSEGFMDRFLLAILDELVKGGEIFSFIKNYWIKY